MQPFRTLALRPRVFLSYATEERDLAGHLAVALRAEGYDVFLDRARLAPGRAFGRALRREIARCDLFVFLASPHSVGEGRYARTELRLAERRWPRPDGRVLAVAAAPVAPRDLPPYLRQTTLLRPEGDPVAETLDAVDALLRGRRAVPARRMALAAGVALLLAVAVTAMDARSPSASTPATLPPVVVTRPAQPMDTIVVPHDTWETLVEVVSGARQQVACP